MNQAIGCTMDGNAGDTAYGMIGNWLAGGTPGPWLTYQKDANMTRPSPSGLWLLLDEHPDSINDGAFAVEMPTAGNLYQTWIDHPSCLHNGACGFSFCDGHALIHRWRDTKWATDLHYHPAFNTGAAWQTPTVFTDIYWVAEHTSAYSNPTESYGFPYIPD